MNRVLSIKNKEINAFLKCPLCKGYLIDAYSINECLHSFCKSCIIKYIKRKECCPTCKVQIIKERMRLFIRRDVNLQYIVYKLIPGLFKNEMQRRRRFYSKHPKAIKFLKKRRICDNESLGILDEDVFVLEKPGNISLSIEYSDTGMSEICDSLRNKENDPPNPKSYLLCPPTMTVELLKKFISMKHQSTIMSRKMDIMYDDNPLKDDISLLDIGYIYAWRRTAPMRLFYRINDEKKNEEALSEAEQMATENSEFLQNKIGDIPNALMDSTSHSEEAANDKENIAEITLNIENEVKKHEVFKSNVNKSIADDEATKTDVVTSLPDGALDNMNSMNDKKESEQHIENENVDVSCNEYNNPTLIDSTNNLSNNQGMNEHLTITSMMESIGSATKKNKNNPREQETNEKPALNKLIPTNSANKSEIESASNKENIDVTNEILSTIDAVSKGYDILNKESDPTNSSSTSSQMKKPELNPSGSFEKQIAPRPTPVVPILPKFPACPENKLKTKSKKNPAEPDSAFGVAKKKKDALTANCTNNANDKNSNVKSQNKKPRMSKTKQANIKQHHGQDQKNIQIKLPEPMQNQAFFQDNLPHQLQFPHIKLEKTYNPQQTFQQFQQQFSLPSIQQMFNKSNTNDTTNSNNTNSNSNSNSNPGSNFNSMQVNQTASNNGGQLLANNFQINPMSLVNHFLNNQKQQQHQLQPKDGWSWNQMNNSQSVTNALQMSQNFNPQLFEYYQSKNQNISQQPQNFFSSHLPNNQFYKSQCDELKTFNKTTNSVGASNMNSSSTVGKHYQDVSNTYYNQMQMNSSSGMNGINHAHQPVSNYSSGGSTCSNEGNEVLAKETGLRSIISESCNLVNELN